MCTQLRIPLKPLGSHHSSIVLRTPPKIPRTASQHISYWGHPLKTLEQHSSTILLRDLKGILNWTPIMGEGHFGATVSTPPTRRHRFGTGQLGAVPFRRRTFRRRFLIFLYFLSYKEKSMKKAISWMPLSVNLLKLESSILPRAKRATSRNNVATEQRI